MCNLYDIGPSSRHRRIGWEDAIRELVDLIGCDYVAPGKPGVVVRYIEGLPIATQMEWGFPRRFDTGLRNVNNARDDKLSGRMWSGAWKDRRCVIPMRRFYEWSGTGRGKKTKHAILPEGEEQDWFWVAGLWEESAPEEFRYTMLTTSANEQMQKIHHRMPVILAREDCEQFLAAGDPPESLVRPYRGELTFNPEVLPPKEEVEMDLFPGLFDQD